jgi:hypothetical protein
LAAGQHLKLTLRADRWLAADTTTQLQTLWAAFRAASDADRQRWARYRLPGAGLIPGPPLDALLDRLAALVPAQPQNMATFVTALVRLDPRLWPQTPSWKVVEGQDPLAGASRLITGLLTGPLAWLGAVAVTADAFHLSPLGTALLHSSPPLLVSPTPLLLLPGLVVLLPDYPHPHDLFTLEQIARFDPAPLLPCASAPLPVRSPAYTLTPETVIPALQQGLSLEHLVAFLESACRRPDSPDQPLRLHADELDTLQGWAAQARRLVLHRLTLLEADDAAFLDRLLQSRTVRAHVTRTLSPRLVALDQSRLPHLLRLLRRQGYFPHAHFPISDRNTTGPLPASGQLWLAGQFLAHLDHYLPLPLRLDHDLLDRLAADLDPAELQAACDLLAQIVHQLEEALDGYSPYPYLPARSDPQTFLPHLQEAVTTGQPLEIVYWTAGRGERTTRTVEPLRLEERDGVEYLIAYCHLATPSVSFAWPASKPSALSPLPILRQGDSPAPPLLPCPDYVIITIAQNLLGWPDVTPSKAKPVLKQGRGKSRFTAEAAESAEKH